jgi:hypothetical protein
VLTSGREEVRMMWTQRIGASFFEIGLALRRPEQLAKRWRDREERPSDAPDPVVFGLLLATAVLGLAAYGLTMGLHLGPKAMIASAVRAPVAAGAAWCVALPALYVIHGALGSRLDVSTTLLAALATVSFGSLAMLASVPVNWFFTLALPYTWARVLVNLLVFSGVGFCMSDVFLRTMRALEPDESLAYPIVWLLLLAIVGTELMVLLDVFTF